MALRGGQPYSSERPAGVPARRRRAKGDQASAVRAGSSGTRLSSSRTSLWTTLPRLEVMATSGRAPAQASGRVTLAATPATASTAAAVATTWSTTTTAGDGMASSRCRKEIGRNSAAGCLASSR